MPGFLASNARLAASIVLKFSVSVRALALTLDAINSGIARYATIATRADTISISNVVKAELDFCLRDLRQVIIFILMKH
jgi:hypothetical protein